MSVLLFLIVLVNILSTESISLGNEYDFDEIILIDDGGIRNVGYQIKGLLKLELLKKNLYLIELVEPKLYVDFKKANKFLPYFSTLDNNDPFLIEIAEGKVKKIFISKDDDKRIINIKKAISNLFQFQTSSFIGEETDLSGTCNVTYKVDIPKYVIKIKDNCIPPNSATSKSVWGGKLISYRNTTINLDNKLMSITSWEQHILKPQLSDIIKANIISKVEIRLIGSKILEDKFPSEDLNEIITKIEADKGKIFETYDIVPDILEMTNTNGPTFSKIIEENTEYFGEKLLGTTKSAEVFVKTVKAARRSSVQDVYKTVSAKKHNKLLPQLMDILGAAQTMNTHQAAMKFLKINSEKYNLNLCERYLWALSMAPTIQYHTVVELQKLVENKHKNIKLWNTMMLTLAAAVNKYSIGDKDFEELIFRTIDFLVSKIKDCSDDDECQHIYIKALGNIPNNRALPILLQTVHPKKKKAGAEAMKVISKMDPQMWNEQVIKLAERVLLSSETYDSSIRLFAVEILLRAKPSSSIQLSRIISILKQEDKSRELKEYLLQRLTELYETCSAFKKLLKKVFIENGLNNYDALGQGGLSTSFSRSFMTNGTLSTSQEIIGGILKQGSVNINLLHNGDKKTPFNLGIFASGLSSFVSDDEFADNDEIATAGLQLTVLGIELRQFMFFNGTGELMGHVWTGTASELTPAYQAILLLDENSYTVPLAAGELLNIRSDAAASLDLSGKIDISLWNRNAKSLVINRAGVLIENGMSISTDYIDADINIDVNIEPELHLLADLEFSGGSTLCLRLQQPETSVKYNSCKSVTMPATHHTLKKSRHLTIPIPGRTYSLNTKNSEMCNKLFN